jgi:hypothetical protein
MSIPSEKRRALIEAKHFLQAIGLYPQIWKRVPLAVRRRALEVLRHYPYEGEIGELKFRGEK